MGNDKGISPVWMKQKHRFTIGEFEISKSYHRPDTHYWIEHESGEGSEFNKADIDKLIKDFYDENFFHFFILLI